MRIGIIGAGAVGGWIGARLALAGHSVGMIARGATLNAVRDDGLILTDLGETLVAHPTATCEPHELGPQELVIVAVKAPALSAAVELARPLITAHTIVVPMLNGVPWWFLPGERITSVDPIGSIEAALPFEQLIGCVVHAACTRITPNNVSVNHGHPMILGEPGGGLSERVRTIADVLSAASIPLDVTTDIRKAIWYKLWGNATVNPISALTRVSVDRILQQPGTRALLSDGMSELARLGEVIGCSVEQTVEDRIKVSERLGVFRTSMHNDVEAGRPIELEALLGAPVEIAHRHGVPVPTLERLYGLTRLMGESLGLL
ncbi:MAG: ketopantoate reductase family protein [Sphingomicrobium sp.]